jgi:hypothetical protein
MENLYVINEKTSTGMTPLFQEPGINDNNELVEIKYEVNPQGNELLAFTWKDENGAPAVLTEWPPKLWPPENNKPYDQMSDEEKEVIKRKASSQSARAAQILECYLGEVNEELLNVNSFKEFAEKVIELLGDSYKGVKVRIKVTYDGKWATVSNKSKYKFIEPMSVPKEKTAIKILGGDKMERPPMTAKVDDESNDTSNPLNDTKSEDADNLPF